MTDEDARIGFPRLDQLQRRTSADMTIGAYCQIRRRALMRLTYHARGLSRDIPRCIPPIGSWETEIPYQAVEAYRAACRIAGGRPPPRPIVAKRSLAETRLVTDADAALRHIRRFFLGALASRQTNEELLSDARRRFLGVVRDAHPRTGARLTCR